METLKSRFDSLLTKSLDETRKATCVAFLACLGEEVGFVIRVEGGGKFSLVGLEEENL